MTRFVIPDGGSGNSGRPRAVQSDMRARMTSSGPRMGPWLVASLVVHAGVAAPLVIHRSQEQDATHTSRDGALHGEGVTLEEAIDVTPAIEEPSGGPGANGAASEPSPTTARPGGEGPRARPRGARSAATAATPSAAPGSEGTTPHLFGAVGERGAVDVATAFTRGFPQAASADAAWVSAPFGDGGNATVVLEIDDAGQFVSSRVTGSPSRALRNGIERTISLLRNRTFTAEGHVTTLHIHARVAPDDVHDGLHGDVFALGASYRGDDGTAFFALAIGRRVDVTVRSGR